MELYLMYLRKSRMDMDYENVSVSETLSRHRTILENLCKTKKLCVRKCWKKSFLVSPFMPALRWCAFWN